MCCRYYMGDYDPEEAMDAYYRDAQRRAEAMGVTMVSRGEVRPTNVAPVIAPGAKDRSPAAFPMKWGFKYPQRDMLIFNIRSETAGDKPLFAPSTESRRCLVPAQCYYEWKREGGEKIKYALRPAEGQLYMAALYFRLPEERLHCFSILTMDARGGAEEIHRRMPVMLPKREIERWLSADVPYEQALKGAVDELIFAPAAS